MQIFKGVTSIEFVQGQYEFMGRAVYPRRPMPAVALITHYFSTRTVPHQRDAENNYLHRQRFIFNYSVR
jgi:hypothetical protein